MSGQVIFETDSVMHSNFGESESPAKIISHPKLSDAFRKVITKTEVEDLVKSVVSADSKLINYYLRPYSEEKIGFLGSHLCLIVVYRKDNCQENETRSFFLKTLPFDVPKQADYIRELGYFCKEIDFFRLLVPLMMENFKGDSWSPKCHLTKDNVLVFEDLKISGFSNRSRIFDERTTMAALASVARFHACSLLAEKRIEGKYFII